VKTEKDFYLKDFLRFCGVSFLFLLFLNGCAALQTPYRDSGISRPAPPKETAAGSLLADANRAIEAGQFNKAEVTLERALRVEPRNPVLWHEMARVKYGKKQYGQAIQFCLKANSLAGRNNSLIRQNWYLIANAYDAMGEKGQAAAAKRKAEAIH